MSEEEINWKAPPEIVLWDGRTKNFEDWGNLKNWVSTQESFWSRLDALGRRYRFLHGVTIGPQQSRFADFTSHLERLSNGRPHDIERAKSAILSIINDLKTGSLLPEDAPIVTEALQYEKADPDLMIGILASHFCDKDHRVDDDRWIQLDETLKCAIAFSRGEFARRFSDDEGCLNAERKAHNDLRNSQTITFQKTITELNATSETWKGQVLGDIEAFRQAREEDQRSFDQLITDLKKAGDDHKAQMKADEEAFKKRMSLEAPRDYWSKVYENSEKVARKAFVAFGVLITAIVLFAWFNGPDIIKTLSELVKGDTPSHIVTLIVAVPLVLVLWLIRHISRLYVSNQTQARDAQYRVTMIETYLALMRDPEAKIERPDIAMVLQALFRPPDGYTAEESMPPTLIDAAKAVISGGK
jgi:hypothetical protein